MIYKIEWVQLKTSPKTGNEYTVMSLTDPEGKKFENVSSFDKGLQAGMEIEGSVVQNGNFLNFKRLDAPAFVKENRGNFKTQQVEKVMERKEQSIGKFQDSKEWSIKVSSTMRDAVLLAIAQGDPSHENVVAQRKWLWNHFDINLEDTDAITGMLN